ncbi:hypothetical protein NDU88_005741 [Pleurodeles waltl]|uniref:Uncharacterized protein n=1 Tax=Pleurodeles waltl TaxID=8319 RepID=A0AAV7MD09_PLEWA|nr:hypothetical protein NDU88_005741 [Pleurodeles waltl]
MNNRPTDNGWKVPQVDSYCIDWISGQSKQAVQHHARTKRQGRRPSSFGEAQHRGPEEAVRSRTGPRTGAAPERRIPPLTSKYDPDLADRIAPAANSARGPRWGRGGPRPPTPPTGPSTVDIAADRNGEPNRSDEPPSLSCTLGSNYVYGSTKKARCTRHSTAIGTQG